MAAPDRLDNPTSKATVFRTNLRRLLNKQCLSQRQAAEKIGVRYKWMRRLCHHGLQRIDKRTATALEQVAEFFGVEVADLWEPGFQRVPEVGSLGKGKATALVSMVDNGLTPAQAKMVFTSLVNQGCQFNDVDAVDLVNDARALVGDIEDNIVEPDAGELDAGEEISIDNKDFLKFVKKAPKRLARCDSDFAELEGVPELDDDVKHHDDVIKRFWNNLRPEHQEQIIQGYGGTYEVNIDTFIYRLLKHYLQHGTSYPPSDTDATDDSSTDIDATDAVEEPSVAAETRTTLKDMIASKDEGLNDFVRSLSEKQDAGMEDEDETDEETLSSAQSKDRIELIHGDCRVELGHIPSGSIDAVITDPPYPEIKRDYGKLTEPQWHDLMHDVVNESRRVLKPTGSAVFILQPNYEHVGQMRMWLWEFVVWAAKEWNIVQDVYAWTSDAMPLAGTSRDQGLLRHSVKTCVWFGSPDCFRNQSNVLMKPSKRTQSRNSSTSLIKPGKNRKSYREARMAAVPLERGGTTPFNMIRIGNGGPRHSDHPATTSRQLADWWCRYLLPEEGVLLDPFAGSGTILWAGLTQGASKVIGIEKKWEYFNEMERHRDDRGFSTAIPGFKKTCGPRSTE
jgi:16S rRNA G966 N2-methylase RsmD